MVLGFCYPLRSQQRVFFGLQLLCRIAISLHAAFGAFMVATAAFSSRSWEASLPFDRIEDVLHSIASNAVGLSFTCGVILILLQRPRAQRWRRIFDCAAFVAAALIPLSMAIWGEIDGVLQRSMFVIAYAWYSGEAVRLLYSKKEKH